jgi:hypothetical protein
MKSPFNLPLIVQFGRDVWTVDDLEELNTVAKEWRWIFLPPTTGSNEWKLSYLDGSKAYDSEESARPRFYWFLERTGKFHEAEEIRTYRKFVKIIGLARVEARLLPPRRIRLDELQQRLERVEEPPDSEYRPKEALLRAINEQVSTDYFDEFCFDRWTEIDQELYDQQNPI